MVAVELVEPINVAVLPLSFLALGAATAVRWRPAGVPGELGPPTGRSASCADSQPTPTTVPTLPYARVTTFVAVAVALFLGVTMVAGDAYMFSGTNSGPGRPFNLAAAKDANRLLPYWPDPALEVAQIEAFDS